MKILTTDVVDYISNQPWPKGLQWGLKESDIQCWIVFYRDNWITLRPEDHEQVASIMFEVLTNLRAKGVPIFMERMESRNAT